MKTISGKPISTKPISLSKASKILSKFVSAENGASQVISAYLHRTSHSFNELNQFHKELKSSHYDKKHKRHGSETHDDREKIKENTIQSVGINQELNHGAVQSMNKFIKYQFDIENIVEDEKKPSQIVVKHCQEPNDAFENHSENEGGSGKHKKKKKKKKHDVEFWEQGDNGVKIGEREGEGKLLVKAVNEDEEKPTQNVVDFSQEPNVAIEHRAGHVVEKEKHKKKKKQEDEYSKHGVNRVGFGEGGNEGKISMKAQESLAQSVESCRELGDAGEGKGMEEGKKHIRDNKKKYKDGISIFSGNKGEVGRPEVKSAMETEDQKEREKILNNSLVGENGGLVVHPELQSRKKKTYKAGSEDKLNTEELKKVQKKRKNEDEVEDRSREPSKKRIKRKHGGDD